MLLRGTTGKVAERRIGDQAQGGGVKENEKGRFSLFSLSSIALLASPFFRLGYFSSRVIRISLRKHSLRKHTEALAQYAAFSRIINAGKSV